MTTSAYSDGRDVDKNFNIPQLYVSVSKTEKQLGQYFRVTIRYTGLNKWSKLNLRDWQQQFKIIQGDEYQDDDEYGNTVQVLKLRLYPRLVGKLELPVLKLGEASSLKIYLQVQPPIVDDSSIKLSWSLSSTSPWLRQPIVLNLQLKTRDISAHVLLSQPEINNAQLKMLPITRKKLDDGMIIFETGWLYYPFTSGNQIIDFPAIKYQLSGSERRRFYLPLQLLQVRALPGYMPPNLPVGKPNLSSELIANDTKWKITLKTKAYIPGGIVDIAKQLAVYSESDMTSVNVFNLTNSNQDKSFYHYVYISSLPAWLMPFGFDKRLELRYFNPDTGKLDNVKFALLRAFKMPSWAWFIFIVLQFGLFAMLAYKIKPFIMKLIEQNKIHRKLKQANNIQQMRKIILNNGQYITLEQWAGKNEKKIKLINKVNYYCFSKINESDFLQLKHALLCLSYF